MKIIKILGTGCPKCEDLLQRTHQAVRELDLGCTVEKVTEIGAIMSYGVIMTPALVVDEQVKVTGRVPAVSEIKTLIAAG